MAVTNIFNLYINGKELNGNYYAFRVNQEDYATRTIQANLYITYQTGTSSNSYTLTDETVTVLYSYTDSNGDVTVTSEDSCTKATSIGSNVVTFVLPDDVLDNAGEVLGQIKIYEDVSDILNSARFRFYVDESIV